MSWQFGRSFSGGFSVAALGKGGVVYEAEAVALFARMTVQPDATRKGLINAVIKSLKASGCWSLLRALYVEAAHDQQAGRLNWIGNTNTLTLVAAPNFLADRGFAGDGSTSYTDSGVTVTDLQDNNHIGMWSLTDLSSTAQIEIGNSTLFTGAGGVSGSGMQTRNNTAANATAVVANSLGHYINTRISPSAYARYKDKVSLGDVAEASGAPNANSIAIGARKTGAAAAASFSTRRVAIAHIGVGLSQQSVNDLHAAFLPYLQAVGAA